MLLAVGAELVPGTHGDFDDTFGLFEHGFEERMELVALDVARDDEEGVDVGPRAVDAEAVGTKGEDFASADGERGSVSEGIRRPSQRGTDVRFPGLCFGEAVVEAGPVHELFDEFVESREDDFAVPALFWPFVDAAVLEFLDERLAHFEVARTRRRNRDRRRYSQIRRHGVRMVLVARCALCGEIAGPGRRASVPRAAPIESAGGGAAGTGRGAARTQHRLARIARRRSV